MRLRILVYTLGLLLLGAAGCRRLSSQDEAAIAAVEWWMAQPSLAGCDTLYVGYPGAYDPQPGFLKRFDGSAPCVLPYSRRPQSEAVSDSADGSAAGGMQVSLSPAMRWSADSLALSYAWHYAPLWGGCGQIVLTRTDGLWTVVDREEFLME